MKISNYQQTNKKVVENYKKQPITSKKRKNPEKKIKKNKGLSFWGILISKRMVQVYGVLFMTFAILLGVSIVYSYFDYTTIATIVESGSKDTNILPGVLGAYLAYGFLNYTFGFFSLGFVLLFFIYGFKLTFERSMLPPLLSTLATLITMAWFSTVFGCLLSDKHSHVSGAFGDQVSIFLLEHTQPWVTGLILFAMFIIILILFYNISPKKMLEVVAEGGKRIAEGFEQKGEGRMEKGERRKQKEAERRREKGEGRKEKRMRRLITPLIPYLSPLTKNFPDYTSKTFVA